MNKRGFFRGLAAVSTVVVLGHATACLAQDAASEAANKKLVVDFYAQLEQASTSGTLKEQAAAIASKYIAPGYIQHQEGGHNGREAFVQMMQDIAGRSAVRAMPPAKLVAIMAEGDKVIQVTSRDFPDPTAGTAKPVLIWNMFRIENGMLAEHWDALPPIPPGMPGPAKP